MPRVGSTMDAPPGTPAPEEVAIGCGDRVLCSNMEPSEP